MVVSIILIAHIIVSSIIDWDTTSDLLSQFLDPKVYTALSVSACIDALLQINFRRDGYSITPHVNALRMLREIVDAIRGLTPPDFVLGIKINSADNVQAKESPSDARFQTEMKRVLDYICRIADWGTVDFIEISGGDYESPGESFMYACTYVISVYFQILCLRGKRHLVRPFSPTFPRLPRNMSNAYNHRAMDPRYPLSSLRVASVPLHISKPHSITTMRTFLV